MYTTKITNMDTFDYGCLISCLEEEIDRTKNCGHDDIIESLNNTLQQVKENVKNDD